MKFHRSTVQAVIDSLKEIFEENRYADKVIEKTLKLDPRWGSRDRRFIAETTYEIVRWYRLIRESGNVADHDYKKLFATWCVLYGMELPPWPDFQEINTRRILEKRNEVEKLRRIRESIPDWLDDLGQEQLGESWEKEIHALNQQANVVLRANRLKINRDQLGKLLREEEVDTGIDSKLADALVLKRRQNVFQLSSFKDGLFEVQDGGSQMIAPFLRVEPGMRVIDACAGAGGKTLHLAALMHNKGRLVAMDTEDWKLEELKKRARRAGAGNIETKIIESSKSIKRLENSADRLLLDVPCSGLGVLRRNPDAKWKLSPDFISKVKVTQQHILGSYSRMLKSGGMMVYSTCSILPEENENQVNKFLTENAEYNLVDQKHVFPSEGYDGFYMCLLQKA